MRGAIVCCALLAVVDLSLGCGGECGEGTVRYQDTCFPFDPLDKTPPEITVSPPIRTRTVGNVTLTSNERATIFVTTDDTEPSTESQSEPDEIVLPGLPDDAIVRFFAIDLAGNRSEPQTVVWRIDQTGPSPPTSFDFVLTNNDRNLTWAAPVDPHIGGVMVARVDGQLTSAPLSGTSYQVGDELEDGVTIVSVDAEATSYDETLPALPGIVRYVAWSFDDLRNYGPPTGDFETVLVPTQVGSIAITQEGGVNVPNPPTQLTISGTATINGTSVAAKITIRNDTKRVLFAPKMIVNQFTNATLASPDGVLSTKQFMRYGTAIQPGASATVTWNLTIPVGTTAGIDFEVKENPVLIGGSHTNLSSSNVSDQLTGQSIDTIDPGLPGPRSRHGVMSGAFTPDGRVLMSGRTSGSVSSFDVASGKKLQSLELGSGRQHVPQVTLDRAGVLGYALLVDNHRKGYQNGSAPETSLIRFDAATMVRHQELPIGRSRNRSLVLTADGKRLLIATGVASQGVIVVDLESFTIERRLIGTRPDAIALAADQRTLYIVGSEIDIVDITNGNLLGSLAMPVFGSGRLLRAALGENDTRLCIAKRSGLAIVGVGGSTITPITVSVSGRVLEVFDNRIYVGSSSIQKLTMDGISDSTPNISVQSQRGHWLGRSPF